jgi:hypothetical protein
MGPGRRPAYTCRLMDKNPLNQGVLTGNSAGIGTVTQNQHLSCAIDAASLEKVFLESR